MFTSVDQLDQTVRALGFNVEFRQLSKGDFFATASTVESQHGCLTSVRFNSSLEIQGESPDGFVAFHFGRFDTGTMSVYAHEMSDGDIVVFSPGCEMEYHTAGEVDNVTLYLPKATFDAACRTVTPRSELLSGGSITHCDPRRFVGIRKKMLDCVVEANPDEETVSQLVAATILLVAEASGQSSHEDLPNDNVVDIARRARSYIEDHLVETIRLEDLCSEVGVSLRTLQRCFSTHFQTCPVAYIKARRLNRARRELVSTDPRSSSVTRIALDNGFAHLGRFSVDYGAHFGESPHQTLAAKVT